MLDQPRPKRPLHVLHVIVGLDVGGAELMLLRLITSQVQVGIVEHRVVSLTTMGEVGSRLQQMGVPLHTLEMRGALSAIRVFIRLLLLIRRAQPDVVQTWMYHADLLGGLAARVAGVGKVIWGIRTTDAMAGGSQITGLVRKLCAWLSPIVPHRIVCAAEASRRTHIGVGYDAAKMTIIPNGYDLSAMESSWQQKTTLRLQCSIGSNDVVVGYLGRFHPAKDQENFVRAVGLLASKNLNVKFMMVGRHLDADNRELNGWISATGHADRFILLGEKSNPAVCLAAMDIFCLSSLTEGFPNVVAEAMAMGLPCVVTDVGDSALLVSDTGVVVPKEDSPALAAGLQQIINLPAAQRIAMGQRARQIVVSKYSLASASAAFESVYKAVLSERRS